MFDLLPIGIAFIFGVFSFRAGLPPLVGYLFAGFLLSNLWSEGKHTLEVFSEFGITLLLFSIGLKLKLKELFRREIFGTALIHFTTSLALFFAVFAIPYFNLGYAVSMLIALSLTFSSTVFVIKLLEERGDIKSHYGRISIGVLIIQDIIAVGFIAISGNQIPSLWSVLLVIGIWPLRLILFKLFSWINHGELMVLLGVVSALTGAFLFDQVNIKGDLGALVFGYLLSSHPRASELNKSLLSFKDFFLLGFFLSIGMQGMPTWEQAGIAALICLALPVRSLLYYYLFNRSGLRSRTSLLGAASLFNYSEFGLIVMAISVSMGWIQPYWASVLALTIAFSYVIASVFNRNVSSLYRKHRLKLVRFENQDVHPLEREIDLGDANVLVFGMGRVGKSVCSSFCQDPKWSPLGFDYSLEVVRAHEGSNIKVKQGDATNPDFWARVDVCKSHIEIAMLAMPLVEQNIKAASALRSEGYTGAISSIAKHKDEIEKLQNSGVDRAFYLYAEAGLGFAESSKQLLEELAKNYDEKKKKNGSGGEA